MNVSNRLLAVLCLVCSAAAASRLPAQTLFLFDFDGTLDSTTTAPLVGSGIVTIQNDPGTDGTFTLASLGTVTFSFDFPALGLTFTNADITTPLNQVRFRFSTEGGGRRLRFSNSSAIGGGPLSGSIDFGNFTTGLTFQPPGPPPGTALDQFFLFSPSGTISGNYYASQSVSAVPEPGTVAAGLLALTVLGWRLRGSRR